MEKPKPRPSPHAPNRGPSARKNTDVQPVKNDDVVLETYEQSPERPGDDERNEPTTPDGAMSHRERPAPD